MVSETPKLNSPELRPIRRNLFGLLVVNFLIYVTILIPLSLNADPDTAVYSVAIIAGYYILEGSLFFGCQAYNWPCTLTFRIIWALHDFAYFITNAWLAAYYKGTYYPNGIEDWDEYCRINYHLYACYNFDDRDEYCDYNNSNDWKCPDYCTKYPSSTKFSCNNFYAFNVACTFFFLLAFGLGIGTIVAFSKLPHLGCCNQTPTQTVAVNRQAHPMQTIQRMPNGQLVMVQNPNAGVYNPTFGVTQQAVIPQTVQYTTQTQTTTVQQTTQQPAVVQPVQQQNDLPPSYDEVCDSEDHFYDRL